VALRPTLSHLVLDISGYFIAASSLPAVIVGRNDGAASFPGGPFAYSRPRKTFQLPGVTRSGGKKQGLLQLKARALLAIIRMNESSASGPS
jgi:hypothetical protein